MKSIIFTDLDDSLFHSKRHFLSLSSHLSESELLKKLTPASLNASGQVICYHTELQQQLCTHLNSLGELIPVTGRSSASVNRIKNLSFESFRIVSHGALILDPQGHFLASWRECISEEIDQWSPLLNDCASYLDKWLSIYPDRIRIKAVYDYEICTYISIKGEASILYEIAEDLYGFCAGAVIHHNQRNLALLPSYANKARAVNHLKSHLQQLNDDPLCFIGVGDSVSDVPFLKSCDFAITPQHSQIHKELWS